MTSTVTIPLDGVELVQLGDYQLLTVSSEALSAVSAKAVAVVAPQDGSPFDVSIIGLRGNRVLTDGDDEAAIFAGISAARSQVGGRSTLTGPLPEGEGSPPATTQIDIKLSTSKSDAPFYDLTYLVAEDAKMRGHLFQEPPAILNPVAFSEFMRRTVPDLVRHAPLPVRVSLVVGSTSAEAALATAACADRGELDHLPSSREGDVGSVRDPDLEVALRALVDETLGTPGACSRARVVRAPRHGGSLPIAIHVGRPSVQVARVRVTAHQATLSTPSS